MARLGNVLLWASPRFSLLGFLFGAIAAGFFIAWLLGFLPSEFIWKFYESLTPIGALALAALVAVQIRDSRKSSQKQLRAYLSVEPSGINPYGSPGEETILGHVEIVNNGLTPGRDIAFIVRMDWSPNPGWRPPSNDPLTKTDIVSQPRARMRIGSGPPKPVSIIETGADTLSYLYVWGRVEYRDEFSETKRFTNFCHRYNCAVFDYATRKIPRSNGRYHENGNDAD
jgi:hypothetical protein